jgi:hypothetical protein
MQKYHLFIAIRNSKGLLYLFGKFSKRIAENVGAVLVAAQGRNEDLFSFMIRGFLNSLVTERIHLVTERIYLVTERSHLVTERSRSDRA